MHICTVINVKYDNAIILIFLYMLNTITSTRVLAVHISVFPLSQNHQRLVDLAAEIYSRFIYDLEIILHL